jgi:hypothetical protein
MGRREEGKKGIISGRHDVPLSRRAEGLKPDAGPKREESEEKKRRRKRKRARRRERRLAAG